VPPKPPITVNRHQGLAGAQLEPAGTARNLTASCRPRERRAIKATEAAISASQREILLAMATGTGKTKTFVALIDRLLKTGRFRRVLFLVDRSELGIQAADAFKETRMESLLLCSEKDKPAVDI
jgi:type I restriction enzyme R subunit